MSTRTSSLEGYQYKPFPQPSPPQFDRLIRLLRLAPGVIGDDVICTISIAIRANTKYDALSYCWGAEDASRRAINLEGHTFHVRQNLFSALEHLRYSDRERVLWVDAVCINQEDLEERSEQVSLMRQIYEDASEAIIWLGVDSRDSDLAIDTLAQISTELDRTTPLNELILAPNSCAFKALKQSGEIKPEILSPINRLFKRPYFTRVWVVQEVFASKGAMTLKCGTRSAPLEAIMRAGICFANHHTRKLEALGVSQSLRRAITETNLWIGRQEYLAQPWESRLLKHVWTYRQRDCSDPRDRIFAFLGISTDHQEYPMSDYTKSINQIYAEYAAYFIRVERSLRILSLCTLDTRMREVPSWAPDWTINFAACPPRSLTQWYAPGLQKFTASGNRPYVGYISRECMVLHAWGIQCFTISALGRQLEISAHPRVGEDQDVRPGSVSQKMWSRLREWLTLLKAHIPEPYPTGEPRSEVTWRTIVTNASSTGHVAQSDVQGLGFAVWLRSPDGRDELGDPHLRQCMAQFMGAASSATFGRRLFFTKAGYMGLAPKCAMVGDEVCVLVGAEVPYVLRRKGQAFEVVGECYCHGIMEGEMMIGPKAGWLNIV